MELAILRSHKVESRRVPDKAETGSQRPVYHLRPTSCPPLTEFTPIWCKCINQGPDQALKLRPPNNISLKKDNHFPVSIPIQMTVCPCSLKGKHTITTRFGHLKRWLKIN